MPDSGVETFARTGSSSRIQICGYLGLAAALLLGLYLTSLYNYLLFHGLAEMFSIVVAFGIFLIAWNSRRYLDNDYLLFLGISYLFVGFVDLVHTLAYKGMGFFQVPESNSATQLWITARYLQSGSLLIAPFFARRTLRPYGILAAYSLLSAALFGAIFYWRIFPDCYLEGTGLTGFKITSEYVICVVLLASLVLLLRIRDRFDKRVLQLLVLSIALTIASELAFTQYVSVYGFANLLGHYFKIISFYLIYRAIIETGFRRPYDLLFRELIQKERALEQERNFTSAILDTTASLVVVSDRYGRIVRWNRACQRMTGYTLDEAQGRTVSDLFVTPPHEPSGKEFFDKALSGHTQKEYESTLTSKDGATLLISWASKVLRDDKSHTEYVVATGIDITARKKAEEELRKSKEHLEMLVAERTVELREANEQLQVELTERKLIEEKLDRLNRELRAISNCNQTLLRAVDEQTLLNDICHIVCDEAGYRMAWVGYPENDDAKTIRPVAWAGAEDGYLEQARLTWADTERGRGPSGTAIRSGESMCIQDFATDPQVVPWRDSALQRGYRSTIALPLKDESANTLGVLNIYSSEPNTFTAEEKSLLEELSGDLAFGIVVLRSRIERKRAEDALYEAQQVFRTLVEKSPDIIARYDRDYRRTYVNPAYLKEAQIPQLELLATAPIQRSPLPEASAAGLHNLLRRVLDSGVAEAIDLIWPKADNFDYWYNIYAFPEFDRAGRVVSVMTVSRDISERKQAEEKNLWLAAIVESSDDAVIGKSLDGIITSWNKGAENIYGYKDTEAVGKPISILAPPDSQDELSMFLARIKRGEHIEHHETVRQKKGGREIDMSLTISAIRNAEGTIVGASTIARDITEQKSLQRQLFQAQKMEAIGTLAGGVAHDFNNILQVALGYSELILGDEELPGHYRADLQKIHESARRGADLVQRVLTFSRKTEIKPQPLNLNRRINEMRKMLERTIPKMIEIQLVLGENLATINADPTQMDQVLMNLAVNARDAMPEGGRLIFETANVVLDEEYAASHLNAKLGHYVLLRATDTGAGMDRETLEHIFEPFYTTKGVGEGTGLGLAMVHGIVHQHGGHIRCYSEPGEGTTFKIYFPALAADEELEETAVTVIPRGGSETILLVDDEEFVRDLGQRLLSRQGYKVLTASNGKEALDVYRSRRDEISLVILDLVMPEMGGKQCLQGLLEIHPKAKVLIASGFSANGPTKDTLIAGAKGFVDKPFALKGLLKAVRETLDKD